MLFSVICFQIKSSITTKCKVEDGEPIGSEFGGNGNCIGGRGNINDQETCLYVTFYVIAIIISIGTPASLPGYWEEKGI